MSISALSKNNSVHGDEFPAGTRFTDLKFPVRPAKSPPAATARAHANRSGLQPGTPSARLNVLEKGGKFFATFAGKNKAESIHGDEFTAGMRFSEVKFPAKPRSGSALVAPQRKSADPAKARPAAVQSVRPHKAPSLAKAEADLKQKAAFHLDIKDLNPKNKGQLKLFKDYLLTLRGARRDARAGAKKPREEKLARLDRLGEKLGIPPNIRQINQATLRDLTPGKKTSAESERITSDLLGLARSIENARQNIS